MGAKFPGRQPMDTAATVGHGGREREKDCCCLRPGPGQWAAMVRALELCRTQPSACPTSTPAHSPAQGQRAWRVPGRRSASYISLCPENDWQQTTGRVGLLTHKCQWLGPNGFMLMAAYCVLSRFSWVHLLWTLWTVALQAPLSVGFSKQEHWNKLPCPLQRIFLTQGSNSRFLYLLHWQAVYHFTTSTTWEALPLHTSPTTNT